MSDQNQHFDCDKCREDVLAWRANFHDRITALEHWSFGTDGTNGVNSKVHTLEASMSAMQKTIWQAGAIIAAAAFIGTGVVMPLAVIFLSHYFKA